MAGIDLDTYSFDYDLTFAALLMNADGTIYHTYAGRDWRDAGSHLSVASFEAALQAGREAHAAYTPGSRPPAPTKPRTVEQMPPMVERIRAGKAPTCYHCHTVNDMRYEDLRAQGSWSLDKLWQWPDPIQLGLTLEKDAPTVIASVEPRSAAERAGLRTGDRLLQVGRTPVATFGDVQRVLHEQGQGPLRLRLVYVRRDAAEKTVALSLRRDWKEATPSVFAWRPSKWPLSPKPGFGGKQLTAAELGAAGLPADSFAFRVGYVVTWGPNAHTGRSAAKAGIRKGDIVFSVAGKSDFESVGHFHAWFRLTQKVGAKVEVGRLRGGTRTMLALPVIE
jgi:hypothetical protein